MATIAKATKCMRIDFKLWLWLPCGKSLLSYRAWLPSLPCKSLITVR